MKNSKTHMILLIVLILVMQFSLIAASQSSLSLPEEIAAPLQVRDLPAVRYWSSPTASIVLPSTIEPQNSREISVPVRQNPKIVPVLYHNIVFGRTGNIYNRDIYNFEHDLAFLRRNYLIIDFSDLIDIQSGSKTISSDATIITFDDGDLSIYAIVFPLLKELQMKATFFIVPNFIGEVGYMSWDQVRQMNSYRTPDGVKLFSFGSHSLTHRPLAELSSAEVLVEMQESKRIIESEIGEQIAVIALPFGSGAGNPDILEAASQSGYRVVRTSQPKAVLASAINLMHVNTFNVENYSTDTFVQHMLKLTGR